LVPGVDAVLEDAFDRCQKSILSLGLVGEGEVEELLEFLGRVMFEECGSWTLARLLETVTRGFCRGIFVGGTYEGDD